MGETFIPTSLRASTSTGLLWVVAGVSNLPGFDHPSFVRARVISGFRKSNFYSSKTKPTLLEDNDIPGGDKMLQKLQGGVAVDEKVSQAAAEALKAAMSNLLVKKQYTAEKRGFRKRTRNESNDRKINSKNEFLATATALLNLIFGETEFDPCCFRDLSS